MADADAPVTGRLIVVGELCVDLIVGLPNGEIRFGQHEQIVPFTELTMGSSSAITACGAAALGVPTLMVGVRGDDEFGTFLDRELRARGVDTGAVRVDAAVATGSSTHLTRPGGDRAILTAMGSIGRTRAEDVRTADWDGAAHMHSGSYFLQEALWRDAAALYAQARRRGVTTSLDGNFDPAQEWDRGIREVLRHTDVFFANDEELRGITREADAAAAAESVLDILPAAGVLVHKEGAAGATALWRDGARTRRLHAATPTVPGELVDTVGAGDSLAAGYLAGLIAREDLAGCLRLGVACGTTSTRGPGGVGAQPDRRRADSIAATVRVMSF